MEIRGLRLKIPGTMRVWVLLAIALLAISVFAELADDDRLTQTAVDFTALGSAAVLVLFSLVLLLFLFAAKDKIGIIHLSVAMGGAAALPIFIISTKNTNDSLAPS